MSHVRAHIDIMEQNQPMSVAKGLHDVSVSVMLLASRERPSCLDVIGLSRNVVLLSTKGIPSYM